MGWRKQMGISELKSPIQKVQNIQKPPEQIPFVPIVPFVYRESKTKTDQTPPPDLSRIQPEDISEYTDLWYRAWELADYVDGGNAVAPYANRVAGLPELNRVVERMRIIEGRLKPGTPSQTKKVPGIPGGWMPNPNHQDPDTCPACGESQWWRKNEPNSKWICGRCHPPAQGLDVILGEKI